MTFFSPSARKRLLRWGKFAAQLAILVLVSWGMWRTMGQAFTDLAEAGVRLRDLDPGWLVASGVTYLISMFPFCSFWRRVLVAMGQRPGYWAALRAYFVSQPGKYVPGKFMVVLVRTAMIRGQHVNTTLAAASAFVETLTVMSIGAVVGAILIPVAFSRDWRLVTFAVLAAIGVGIPTFPPVFRMVAKLTKLHRLHPEIDVALQGLHMCALAPGWAAVTAGWFVMGFSLWAAIQAIPGVTASSSHWMNILMLTAGVALSTVAGFVSGLPGGLGAREWVVIHLIQPHFGAPVAVLSAVIHRGVMLVAELVAGAILWALPPSSESGDQ